MLKIATPFLTLLLIARSIASAQETTRTRSDAEVTARVKTALIRNAETKARQVNVETENGVVQLSGFVDTEQMQATAAATAKSIFRRSGSPQRTDRASGRPKRRSSY